MKSTSIICGLLLFLICQKAEGQRIADYHTNISYSKSFNPGVYNVELGLNKDLFNFLDNNLRLGFGARIGFQNHSNIAFKSARKSIKSNAENIDTLIYDAVQAFGVNFYAHGEYYLKKKWAVGVNLDLVGISLGWDKNASYRPGPASQKGGTMVDNNAKARPTAANAFSFGDQKGLLTSQLFVRFEPNKQFAIRAGFAILMSEFSTDKTYGSNQQYRFERNTGAFMLGVTFNKFDNK